MIKKLQQLKAKKGFTLVELIVVIAIIGVLAAILVPTMMGFVTNSRVTSANSTAASFEDQIEQFLTDCDTKGYGMKSAATSVSQINIVITPTASGNSTWTTTIVTPASFKSITGGADWTTAGSAMAATDTAIAQANVPANLLSIKLMSLFPDVKQGVVMAYAKAGNVEALLYTADATTASDTAIGNVASAAYDTSTGVLSGTGVNWANKTCAWDTKTAGISNTGLTVGTSPALSLG